MAKALNVSYEIADDVEAVYADETSGTGTRYTISGEVKVSIPLIGGKAESFVLDMVTKLMAKEAELLGTLV